MSRIIDGRSLAQHRELLLKHQVDSLAAKTGRHPVLVAFELSRDLGSRLYLKLKERAAERIGIEFEVARRSNPDATSGLDLKKLSADGIFIQHPAGYDKQKWQELADKIPPEKDVDCLTGENLNLIKQGRPRFLPATVKAIGYCLVQALGIQRFDPDVRRGRTLSDLSDSLRGRHIVILGRSPIVGQPLAWWFEGWGIKFAVLHSQTKIEEQVSKIKNADVIISATGRPGIITGEMVKAGVVVIDVGSPLGDVDFASVSQKAKAITPVPGGVGPLTVISLMENVVQAVTNKVVL